MLYLCYSVNPDELLLRMGEFDLNDEFSEPFSYQDRKVQIVASHPKFDPKTFEYDLALLRFYEPVTFQPNIVPICVPDSDEDLVGETAWVTGWGRLYEGKYLGNCYYIFQSPADTCCFQMAHFLQFCKKLIFQSLPMMNVS